MKNILESVQNFKTKRQEAIENYKRTMAIVNRNYIKGSDKYKERVKSLKEERDTTISSLKAAGLATLEQEMTSIRGSITKIVGIAPSEEMERAISKLKGMTDIEKNIMYEQLKENASYMDMKMLNAAMGKPFATVDGLLEDLDYMEQSLRNYFNDYVAGSYRCLDIEYGASLNALDEQVNDFVGQYAGSAK